MELTRSKEFVNQFHFDGRNLQWEKENGEPKTRLQVDFQLIEKNQEENKTVMVTILHYMVVLNTHVISGSMTQKVEVLNRIVEEPSEFTDEDRRELALPLLDMLKRLTYEVTEIAFDAPGMKLEF
ncbi:DUF1149 family protein [Streptococcus sp. X16XC17]|uniref:DUF1149 family protein n=1 Tax=unclassified Streptococcus TaxID=2608887 RepID=UPI00066FD906|nr:MULTISPECIES: DUF1149 family protein [unclassified Streptococcus]TCD46314.1 DUF1149 family protein [Streptococcus sp. X16XC17]